MLSAAAAAVWARADLPPVTLTASGGRYILANAFVRATIDRRTGDLTSLRYRGLELLGRNSGHPGGYWEQNPSRAARLMDAVTIDPAANGGERAEVAIRGISDGRRLTDGYGREGTRCDLELRYALGRGDSGLYTYAIFSHPAAYGADQIGESRFGAKLNPAVFDWMTIDARVNRLMPTPSDWVRGIELNMKEARRLTTGRYRGQVEHKYDYSAVQFDTPAYGWSSTRDRVGFWFINPSTEYLSGGPTKPELTGHLDLTATPDPTLLDYWRSTHYGGSFCGIGAGEAWSKVVGPIFLYCNAGPDPQAMWRDALRQAAVEAGRWPYGWVNGVDYPHRAERGEVSGRLVIDDPQEPNLRANSLLVGLTAPDYRIRDFRGDRIAVDWQTDAKHYEFWTRGEPDGRFDLSNVRPGTYVLRAIADGVLGEFALGGVSVRPGGRLELGTLRWQPVRYGRQLWDIGIPNRSAREFFHGGDYNHWGLYLQYPKWFPHDVDYTIGRSDFRRDWNFEQVPRVSGDGDDGRGRGSATPWTVRFHLPDAPRGRAILRLAICGVGARSILIRVNGRRGGQVDDLRYNAVINRDGIQGTWSEHDVAFDAALLRAGANTVQLVVPAGSPMAGIEYDYIRLELAPP